MVSRQVVTLIALTCLAVIGAFGQDILLGVLEDNPGHYYGDPNFRAVRAVFKKRGSDWRSFRSDCPDQDCLKTVVSDDPREVEWTITFDGKNMGRVTARTPKEFGWYASVGQQEITSTGAVPTVGQREAKYGGYLGRPVYRPLVADSRPYFRDPESWEPSQVSSDIVRLVRQQFRRQFSKVCRINRHDETKLEPFPYRDEDVHSVKAYASKKGWTVVRMHLEDAIDCNNPEAAIDIGDPWYAVDPSRSAKYLDSGLWLIDAGDYDDDGKSELLFLISRDNRDGYELFYDDFEKHVAFEYSYH